MTWLWSLPARIKLWAAGLVAILAAFAGIYAKGRGDAKRDAKLDAMQEEIEAHETRDKVDADAGRGDARSRLREWQRD